MYFYYPSERDQTIDLTGELLKNVGAYSQGEKNNIHSQEEGRQHIQSAGRKTTQ